MIGEIRQWLPAPAVSGPRAGRKFKIIDGYDPGDPTLFYGPRLHIEYLDDGSQESITRQAVGLGSITCEDEPTWC